MKALILSLLLAPGAAHAEDERARRDLNGAPTEMAVSDTTGEIRRLKSTNDGFLIVITTAAPGSSGAATEATLSSIDGKTPSLGQATSANSVPVVVSTDSTVSLNASGNDTPFVSTFSVSGSTVTVMAADVGRESSLVCNEGPEVARCASASQVTASVGQRLLVDQCHTWDGPAKPYRGALSCVSTTGNPTKITASEGN